MTVITEIDQILELLEREIPANINSPQNQRLENGLRKELVRYFQSLEQAFPYDALEQLYYKKVGTPESDRPPKSIILAEPLVEVAEPVMIQGLPGEKGEQGVKGDTGDRGEQGLPGLKGDRGLEGRQGDRGEQGIPGAKGEPGEQGLVGGKGEQGEQGDKGDTGDPGLTKKQQTDIKGIIKDFSGKQFVEDDDPRLKDAREPKTHKHPEIQPIVMAYPVMNVGGISGGDGVQSEPPEGYLEVTNIYYDPVTEKMIVVYKS